MIEVKAPKRTLIGIDAYDDTGKTVFTSTTRELIKNRQKLYARLPLSPETGYVEVYNANYPKGDSRRNSGFVVLCKKEMPLVANFGMIESEDESVLNAIKFFEQFARRAAFLSAGKHLPEEKGGSFYSSDDGLITIQFLDEIIDWRKCVMDRASDLMVDNPNYGKEMRTSMRIARDTGLIQVSKKLLLQYTVAEIIAVLLHEYSHYWRNYEQDNEFEADLNAMIIYSALGFSPVEAGTAFHKVFTRTPSDLNIDRIRQIIRFLKNVDRQYSLLQEDANANLLFSQAA